MTIKREAHRIVESLPEDATWEDFMDRIYVREAVEAGLANGQAARALEVEEIRRRFGLRK